MSNKYVSNGIRNATSLDEAIALVNAGTCEGVEGIEFSSDQLAGQYAFEAARQQEDFSEESIEAHLEFLASAGAEFDAGAATVWGLGLAQVYLN